MSQTQSSLAKRIYRYAKMHGATRLSGETSEPWRSLLFDGTRHVIRLRIDGDGACGAVDAICTAARDGTLDLPCRLIVDLQVRTLDAQAGGVDVTLEALTVDA